MIFSHLEIASRDAKVLSHWFDAAIDFALPIHTEESVRTDDQRGYTGCARTGGRYESTWADKSTICHERRNPVFLKNILRPYGLGHLFYDLQTMKNMSEIVVPQCEPLKPIDQKDARGTIFWIRAFLNYKTQIVQKVEFRYCSRNTGPQETDSRTTKFFLEALDVTWWAFFDVGACAHIKSPTHPYPDLRFLHNLCNIR